MRYLALLATTLALASGCTLVFDGGGGDDVCILNADPALAPAPQRNPDSLECQSFGGPACDPRCGPCPALDLAPTPTWGFCGSSCEQLSEAACAAAPECRVVKDLDCVHAGTCATDFLGCFPTDQLADPTLDCRAARDATTCSRSNACTAYHYRHLTGARDATNVRAFAVCAPEGKAPGSCYAPVICARPRPVCPSLQWPVIVDGCYTGACMPVDACEAPPPPV